MHILKLPIEYIAVSPLWIFAMEVIELGRRVCIAR